MDTIPTIQPVQPAVPEKPKKSKLVLLEIGFFELGFVIVLLAIAFGVLGYFHILNLQKLLPAPKDTTQSASTSEQSIADEQIHATFQSRFLPQKNTYMFHRNDTTDTITSSWHIKNDQHTITTGAYFEFASPNDTNPGSKFDLEDVLASTSAAVGISIDTIGKAASSYLATDLTKTPWNCTKGALTIAICKQSYTTTAGIYQTSITSFYIAATSTTPGTNRVEITSCFLPSKGSSKTLKEQCIMP